MSSSWQLLVGHARAHHATITWNEARGLGISARQITTWTATGRLVRAAPNVYAVAGAPATWRQRLSVAAGSLGGWASHRAAAALWGLDGFSPRQIEVLVPYGLRRRRTEWTVDESRSIRGVDLDEVDDIPCTSLVRTILDVAAVAHPFRVAQALDHASRRWPGTLDAVTYDDVTKRRDETGKELLELYRDRERSRSVRPQVPDRS
jgi:predicted transcriptional regulator of viral defense system